MLNERQKEIIENSMWVINTILKDLKQQRNDDIRQDLILFMCQLLDRYDPLMQTKWTTFAYKNISLYARTLIRNENERQKNNIYVEEPKYYKEHKGIHKNIDPRIQELYKKCNDKEKKLIETYLDGYTTYETARREIGCGLATMSRLMESIREKANEDDRQL